MFIKTITIFLLVMSFNSIFAGTELTSTNISQKIEERSKQLVNLRFRYSVDTNLIDAMVQGTKIEKDLSLRKRDEVFSIMQSNSDTHPLPWISWIISYPKKGRTPIGSFYIYDGTNNYRFLRGDPQIADVVPINFGLIDAGYNNIFMIENYFERILFLKINGSSLNMDSIKKSTSMRDYHYVRDTDYSGKRAHLFERIRVPGKILNIATVITDPCVMTVSYKTVSIPDNNLLSEMKVEELGSFEGLFYPRRGSYRETESQRSYTFFVNSVERLTENARKDWVPNWPGGTDVRDIVNNDAYTIERSPKEAVSILSELRPPIVHAQSRLSYKTWFLFIFNILLIIVALSIFRKRHKQLKS